MKKILIILNTAIFCSSTYILPAQDAGYKINSQQVLAISNGLNYTEGHFEKRLRFLEFLLGTTITKKEKHIGVEESIA